MQQAADDSRSTRSEIRDGESSNGGSNLNPYSCLLCRKKKKKCDRIHPCWNCRKAGAEWVFAPRKPSSRQKAQVSAMERLRQLEDVIGRLRADIEPSRLPVDDDLDKIPVHKDNHVSGETERTDDVQSCTADTTELESEFGRLAIGDGRSRYVVGSFWANLYEEVCMHEDTPEAALTR